MRACQMVEHELNHDHRRYREPDSLSVTRQVPGGPVTQRALVGSTGVRRLAFAEELRRGGAGGLVKAVRVQDRGRGQGGDDGVTGFVGPLLVFFSHDDTGSALREFQESIDQKSSTCDKSPLSQVRK